MSDGIIKVSRNTTNAPQCPFSTQTVAFSHYNNISAQLPIDPISGQLVSGDFSSQARQCFINIQAIVDSIDHVMSDIVKLNIYLKNIEDLDALNEVYPEFFTDYMPTRSVIAVEALPLSDALLQIDAVVSNGEGTPSQQPCDLIKLARNTDNAPLSKVSTQTVAFSHYNNLTAQLPIDPVTGDLIGGGIKEQARQCLHNIKAVMESIDVPFDDIVRVNVHLTDLSKIDAVDEIYRTFFPDASIARTVGYMPARNVVCASALPLGALVQMDVVVSHGDGTPPQEIEDRHGIVIRARNTEAAPISDLSTQSVAFSHYNHISGQLPLDASGELASAEVTQQAKQCLDHIQVIAKSIGHKMDDIVKVNIQLQNVDDISKVNQIYTSYFDHDLPARTIIGVADIPKDALIQIDAVMSNGEGTPP